MHKNGNLIVNKVNYSLNFVLVSLCMHIATYNIISTSPTYPTGGSYCEGPGSVGPEGPSVGELVALAHTPGQTHFVVK